MIINNVDMPNFTRKEFPEDPVKYAHIKLLSAIQGYRYKLKNNFHISPVKGALARFDGSITSRHRIMKENGKVFQLSIAIDGFPDGDPFKAWLTAQACGLFNGVGVYFDTTFKAQVRIMLHLDLRSSPLIWYRANGVYYYPNEPEFYKKLIRAFHNH